MSKRIGLVGIPFELLITYLLENGYTPVALIDRDVPHEFPASVTEQYILPLQNKSDLNDDPQLSELRLDGVIASFENYILSKAWLSEALNLPGISISAAEISTDKKLMREAFSKHCPEFSPAFAEVSSLQDVQNFLQAHPGPVVLKPANLVKSLLVTLCLNPEDALTAYPAIMEKIQDVYNENGVINRKPKMIIEEYLIGPYFSVDGFVDHAGNITVLPVVDLIMGKERGFEDHHNFSRKLPSQFSNQETTSLQEAARAGIKALGLTSSGAHCEFVLTKNGPRLIEIGARFGGYRPLMYTQCYNIKLFQVEVDLALGKIPQIEPKNGSHMAVYEVFPHNTGIVTEIPGLDELQNLPSLRRYRVRTPVGSRAGTARDGFRFALLIQLETKDEDQFLTDTKWIEQNVKVITKK